MAYQLLALCFSFKFPVAVQVKVHAPSSKHQLQRRFMAQQLSGLVPEEEPCTVSCQHGAAAVPSLSIYIYTYSYLSYLYLL